MKKSQVRSSFPLFAAIVALWFCTGVSAPAAVASEDVLMQETFQQFDQNLEGGWRTLQLKRDYLGAADAMLEYLSGHSATLKPWQKDSLAFHLGHVYAMAGKRREAIHWFQKSIADHRMGNPAYVKSFMAFIENDKPALMADRHTIAATSASHWRAEDLSEMDAMLDYFGEPFEAAWGALNCHNPAIKKTTAEWISYCQAVDVKYRKIYLQHGIKLQSQ